MVIILKRKTLIMRRVAESFQRSIIALVDRVDSVKISHEF